MTVKKQKRRPRNKKALQVNEEFRTLGIEKRMCTACEKVRTFAEFGKKASDRDGIHTICRECMNKRRMEVYYGDHENKKRENRESARRNKEAQRPAKIAYRKSEQGKKIKKAYTKKYLEDPWNDLRRKVGIELNHIFKDIRKCHDFLLKSPWTRDELLERLISTIPKGYTVNDYGPVLVIDHIYPHSKMPYEDYDCENFRIANALENLRLCTREENNTKGDRVIPELLEEHGISHYIDLFGGPEHE